MNLLPQGVQWWALWLDTSPRSSSNGFEQEAPNHLRFETPAGHQKKSMGSAERCSCANVDENEGFELMA